MLKIMMIILLIKSNKETENEIIILLSFGFLILKSQILVVVKLFIACNLGKSQHKILLRLSLSTGGLKLDKIAT